MFPGYNFNETEGRLEPLDNTCIYCQKNYSHGMETNYLLQVYMEKGRTDLIVFKTVNYGSLKIVIPRCKQCRKGHAQVKLYARLCTWFAIIITMVLGFFIGGAYGGLIAIFSAIGIGVYTLTFGERKLLHSKAIPSEGTGVQKVPLVQELMADGWTLIAPFA